VLRVKPPHSVEHTERVYAQTRNIRHTASLYRTHSVGIPYQIPTYHQNLYIIGNLSLIFMYWSYYVEFLQDLRNIPPLKINFSCHTDP
jgi:hypothetical protein